MMTDKRKCYFGYQIINGEPCSVLFHGDLPTDGNSKFTVVLKQQVELPERQQSLTLNELSIIYPYNKEETKDEKFKI